LREDTPDRLADVAGDVVNRHEDDQGFVGHDFLVTTF
jgi:hypothetical protein